jgi:Tfp pilus assembly protein FimT
MNSRRFSGASLIEAMTTVSVISILVTSALPVYTDFTESRRMLGAAELVRAFLVNARAEALRQRRTIVVTYSMTGAPGWRLGMRDASQCETALSDPEDPDACSIPGPTGRLLSILNGNDLIAISGVANRSNTRFDPMRGTSFGTNATITLTSTGGKQARVIISNSGRIRTCSPNGNARLADLPNC